MVFYLVAPGGRTQVFMSCADVIVEERRALCAGSTQTEREGLVD